MSRSKSATSPSNTMIINKDEFEFLKWYEYLTPDDIVEIIEHRIVFEKYCRIRARQIIIDLANFKYVDKEKEAYISTNTISELVSWIGKQIDEYIAYVKELDEANEDKQTKEDKEILKIKRKYKI